MTCKPSTVGRFTTNNFWTGLKNQASNSSRHIYGKHVKLVSCPPGPSLGTGQAAATGWWHEEAMSGVNAGIAYTLQLKRPQLGSMLQSSAVGPAPELLALETPHRLDDRSMGQNQPAAHRFDSSAKRYDWVISSAKLYQNGIGKSQSPCLLLYLEVCHCQSSSEILVDLDSVSFNQIFAAHLSPSLPTFKRASILIFFFFLLG